MADSNTALGKLLNALRSQRDYVPSTLTFPQLDVPAMAERLRLTQRAEENGRKNRPSSSTRERPYLDIATWKNAPLFTVEVSITV